ncbi:MAG: hypothetical protein CL764_05125 [Chloroflexi bacterium]|nr:hypothetical protein [Chloroflexota bacterium]
MILIKKLILLSSIFIFLIPLERTAADGFPYKPEGKLIMSVYNRDQEQFDLVWMNPDGTGNPILITQTPFCDEIEPTFSPDGKKVAYSSNCNGVGGYYDGFYRIFIVDLTKPESAKTPQILTSNNTMKGGSNSPSNSYHPSWAWNQDFLKGSSDNPNGPIIFQTDLNGDMGIYMKYQEAPMLPAIKIRDKKGVNEIEPTWNKKGAYTGQFRDQYLYSWIEQGESSNQGIAIGTLGHDPYKRCPPYGPKKYAEEVNGFQRTNEPRDYVIKNGCQEIDGSKWTMGIDGHSVTWFEGDNDGDKWFRGSKGQPVFAYVRDSRTPGLDGSTLRWATVPDISLFGSGEFHSGEWMGPVFGSLGKEFTSLKAPKFSPYGKPILAHFMQDLNPIKSDNGSFKILQARNGDIIVDRYEMSPLNMDFDWGTSFMLDNYRDEIFSRSKIQDEANELERQLKELEQKQKEKFEEEERLRQEELEIQSLLQEDLSREQQIELENEQKRLEMERMRVEQEAQLDLERERFELERQRQQLELDREREMFEMEQKAMMEELEAGNRYVVYEEEKCFVEDNNQARGLFGNHEIGSEIDCDFGNDLSKKFEDPTNLAMLGLVVTVGATLLQMFRGH